MNKKIKFKPYTIENKNRLIEIFKSNCPKYFSLDEEVEFIDFLDNHAFKNFLVVINEFDRIIGCGGYYIKNKSNRIVWTMLERNSIGTRNINKVAHAFFKHLENSIKQLNNAYKIHISTTQLMEKLFNTFGFITYNVIKNGYGQGLDEYEMSKLIADKSR